MISLDSNRAPASPHGLPSPRSYLDFGSSGSLEGRAEEVPSHHRSGGGVVGPRLSLPLPNPSLLNHPSYHGRCCRPPPPLPPPLPPPPPPRRDAALAAAASSTATLAAAAAAAAAATTASSTADPAATAADAVAAAAAAVAATAAAAAAADAHAGSRACRCCCSALACRVREPARCMHCCMREPRAHAAHRAGKMRKHASLRCSCSCARVRCPVPSSMLATSYTGPH